MNIDLEPGTYVVAASGGVDSMALLHQLTRHAETAPIKLIVAHLDHGIRDDSAEDRRLVSSFAQRHGLPFVYHEAALGKQVSEAQARQARYDFLHQVRQASNARAIITAHHQDDVLETAVHNVLRGTGRKGVTSLGEHEHIRRPLLHISKDELKKYAKQHQIAWRDDVTNHDTTYARNYIRHRVLPRMDSAQKQSLQSHIYKMHALNHEIDKLVGFYLHLQPAVDRLDRKEFIRLPHVVAREVMASWLRNNGVSKFDRRLLEQLVTAAKTLRVGKFMSIDGTRSLSITADELALLRSHR